MFPALAFLPLPADIPQAFDDLVKILPEDASPICTWFEENYAKRKTPARTQKIAATLSSIILFSNRSNGHRPSKNTKQSRSLA